MRLHVLKGLYVEQLERWFGLFSPERFLILSLEGMQDKKGGGGGGGMERSFGEVCGFLGVPAVGPGGFATHAHLRVRDSTPLEWSDCLYYAFLPPFPSSSSYPSLSCARFGGLPQEQTRKQHFPKALTLATTRLPTK